MNYGYIVLLDKDETRQVLGLIKLENDNRTEEEIMEYIEQKYDEWENLNVGGNHCSFMEYLKECVSKLDETDKFTILEDVWSMGI